MLISGPLLRLLGIVCSFRFPRLHHRGVYVPMIPSAAVCRSSAHDSKGTANRAYLASTYGPTPSEARNAPALGHQLHAWQGTRKVALVQRSSKPTDLDAVFAVVHQALCSLVYWSYCNHIAANAPSVEDLLPTPDATALFPSTGYYLFDITNSQGRYPQSQHQHMHAWNQVL